MGLSSGRDGRVMCDGEIVADLAGWSLLTTSRGKSYASSATGGFRRRLPGVREATGKISGRLGPGAAVAAQLREGAIVVLRLYVSPAAYYEVPAVIDGLGVVVDVERDEIIGWEADYTSDGAWTEPA